MGFALKPVWKASTCLKTVCFLFAVHLHADKKAKKQKLGGRPKTAFSTAIGNGLYRIRDVFFQRIVA